MADRLTRRLTRTVFLAATLTACLIGASAQDAEADGERLDINPMLSWFPVFPGGVHWTAEGRKILCDAPTGVELRVEPAVKSGPILRADQPWEAGDIGWAQVIRDEGRYRMWYQTKPTRDKTTGAKGPSYLCYAESDDGFQWRKPRLGLFEFDGDKSNNILRLADKGFFVYRDPTAPPAERYRMMTRRVWHEGDDGKILSPTEVKQRRTHNNEIKAGRAKGTPLPLRHHNVMVASHSPDGLRWTRYSGPILADGVSHDTQNTFTRDPKRGTYVGYFRSFYGYRRAIGRSETKDFLRWPDTRWNHHTLIEDAPDATLYSNAYSSYPGNPDIHLMFPAIYHQLADATDAQLMVSMDGLNWSRHTKQPIIQRGRPGQRDQGGVYPVPQLLRFPGDHKFRMPIRQAGTYHNQAYQRQQQGKPTDALAWAEWEEDRLAGITAREDGQFTLAPMLCGDRLLANFRTEKDGWIRFELAPPPVWPPLPAEGIEGYRFEDMNPLSGDQTDVPVEWSGKTGLTAHKGKRLAIRVRMHKATLYSIAMATRDKPSPINTQPKQTGAKELSPFARKLLAADEADLKRLSLGASQGLIELAPANLPANPKGDNDHFGWPVATMLDDTLIVVHRAMPGHNRKLSGNADADTTYSTIVRSTDGGQTWSEQYDVRQCMTEEDRNRGGAVPLSHRYKFDPGNHSPLGYKLHLNAIGTMRDGAVVLVSDHGAFRSEDKGRTWKHLREAFREDRHDGPFVSVGPRIIDHPEHGLLLFAHHNVFKNHRPHDIVRELAVYRSRDRGESWEKTRLALPDWCKPAEPDVIFHDDQFAAIVRNQRPTNILAQMRFQFGDAKISDVANTNMKTRRSVDTSAICFNPVTKRYEVVQSKREDMSINLFSIAPEDWNTAKWRFEGQLFKRTGSFYSTADGFHTGGAVIDEKRGVQHVFFYSGHPGGPAGVFRLTRTLDTAKLAEFLKPRNRPDKRDTVHWTGNAKSANWNDSGNWDLGVPDQHDVVIFDQRAAGQTIHIDDVVRLGRIDLRLEKMTDRLTLTGSGTLVIHGAETIRNKYSTAMIQTGILDLGAELNVEIRNQRFIAGNQDGTIVIRSNRVRAGKKESTSNSYKSDGENLKLGITDRGGILLMTEHWEPGMSLDMSASHTEGPKVFDFALADSQQGVTFIRLKEHDGDPVEIRGFDDDDFFRFRADPFKSGDKGKVFRIDAVKFVGWPDNGKASVEQRGEYWYLKPATASLPETLSTRKPLQQ